MKLFLTNTLRRQLGVTSGGIGAAGGVRIRTAQDGRDLAYRLKLHARGKGVPKAAPSGGLLFGLALLEEVWQRVIGLYLQSRDSRFLRRGLEVLAERMGEEALQQVLDRFSADFLSEDPDRRPPEGPGGLPGRTTVERQVAFKELLVFWLIHSNPAARSQISLLHDGELIHDPSFAHFTEALEELLANLPGLDEDDESLLAMLTAPYRAAPDSIGRQLQVMLRRWGRLMGGLGDLIQLGIDVIAEEEAPRFSVGPGPIEAPALVFDDDTGTASYSQDGDWMPELVLVAKNIFVWLDQLSRAHGRPIRRLDEIPDPELESLARAGFSGLWLIGIWERSLASERIKRQAGNPEAMASAYSLRRYQVAEGLGGETALELLDQRAARHGIRLAADMVPNHTGIDSDWLLEQPDWYLGELSCPFPSYSFEGPDLSPSSQVGIYLEDHYWDRSDAAVVFKRLDRNTGETRFIYHGNDGTSMPWNDTAQLDYLNPELREAVIETIISVARRFPVIRFDAAMTLAKKHFQRLWFPEPGDSGAIPSRAERGLSRAEFDRHMPKEFWREVVDRARLEAPDTLLMAEAFWLMEGYFVRSLGMHRVYNSAFMNMLRDRKNADYRTLIKETLEFDPRILGRYVNFMSNPDEATAVEQFGRGDFYFGVCTLMATLPGLPMFAHGQVAGLAEKYGMEFRQAYSQERPDEEMMTRHRWQIAPLLHRRELFAGIERFRFFDCLDFSGTVVEDVYALVNGIDDERVLVLFNNSEAVTTVQLFDSVPFRDCASDELGPLKTERLSDALGFGSDPRLLVRFRDSISGEEFLVRSRDLDAQGLHVELGPFQCRVFGEFSGLWDVQGRWDPLVTRLAGRGIGSLESALRSLELEPLQRAFDESLSAELASRLLALPEADSESGAQGCREQLRTALVGLLDWIARRWRVSQGHEAEVAAGEAQILGTLSLLRGPTVPAASDPKGEAEAAGSNTLAALRESPELLVGLVAGILIRVASKVLHASHADRDLVDAWLPAQQVERLLVSVGVPFIRARGLSHTLDLDLQRRGLGGKAPATALELLRAWLSDSDFRAVLDVHRYEAEEFLRKEPLEILLRWHFLQAVLEERSTDRRAGTGSSDAWSKLTAEVLSLVRAADYRVQELLDQLKEPAD